jgi:hypothetical protein
MKPGGWSHRLGRTHNLPTGLWSFRNPNKKKCASFCGRRLCLKTRVPELRPTGLNGSLQVWYYCPQCWRALVLLRKLTNPVVSLKSSLESLILELQV